MTPITPKALSEVEFSKTLRGYTPAEVDSYLQKVLENYTFLYRENIELAKRLGEANTHLENLTSEEETVRQELQTAKNIGDQIIEDAYVKADDILAAIKTSCDSILRNFRDKIETQKTALADIQQNILTFKNELFEKYRLHIELIEQLSPVYEYEEELSPAEYVDKVVTGLKREVAAQYGISLESLAAEAAEAALSTDGAETRPFEAQKADSRPAAPARGEEKPAKAQEPAPKKKKTRSIPSVMELLDEYEDKELLSQADDRTPKAHQLMLDLDGENNGEPLFEAQ